MSERGTPGAAVCAPQQRHGAAVTARGQLLVTGIPDIGFWRESMFATFCRLASTWPR